jgi:hypothetical protein
VASTSSRRTPTLPLHTPLHLLRELLLRNLLRCTLLCSALLRSTLLRLALLLLRLRLLLLSAHSHMLLPVCGLTSAATVPASKRSVQQQGTASSVRGAQHKPTQMKLLTASTNTHLTAKAQHALWLILLTPFFCVSNCLHTAQG